jgi:hypothetical protein
MSRPDRYKSDRVPLLMNTIRIDRPWIRAGRPRPRIDRRVLLVLASVIAVFACSFAIGRMTHSQGVPRAATPTSLPASLGKAAIPVRLQKVPPIAFGSLTSAGTHHQAPKAASTPTSTPAQESTSSSQSAPPAVSAPAPTATPSPAPTPVQTPHATAPHSEGGSSGGGSFDSSG